MMMNKTKTSRAECCLLVLDSFSGDFGKRFFSTGMR